MYYGQTKYCKNCGKQLAKHERPDKECCDDNCRKAYSRRKEKVNKTANEALYRIVNLGRMLAEYPELKEMISQNLITLQRQIGSQLEGVTAASVTDNIDARRDTA